MNYFGTFFGKRGPDEPVSPDVVIGTPSIVPPVVESSTANVNVYPQICVLPCLQELKQGGRVIVNTFGKTIGNAITGGEWEQEPGYLDDTKSKMVPFFSIGNGYPDDASKYFDTMWATGNTSGNATKDLYKNGLLEIPNMTEFGFKGQCKNMSCTEKWTMYTKFLCSKFGNMEIKDNNIAMLVTHHNRMRINDFYQALLPFKKYAGRLYGKAPYDAYANNFCLKIEIKKEGAEPKIYFSIVFPGFPDKGEFESNYCKEFPIITQNFGTYQSGGGYKYFCGENDNTFVTSFIDTDKIISGIRSGLETDNINMIIYLIRHGNALHNKPVSLKTDMERLDSALTPLGMLQAKILGEILRGEIEKDSSSCNIIIGCSFLQRTQLTAMLILDSAGILQLQEMKDALNSMQKDALIRWINSGKDYSIFFGYSPLGTLIKNARGKKEPKQRLKSKIEFEQFLGNLAEKFQVKKLIESQNQVVSDVVADVGGPDVVAPVVDPDVDDGDDDPIISCEKGSCFPSGGKNKHNKTHKNGKKARKGRKTKKARKARKSKKVRKQSKNKTRRSKK
jgi:hypothetical protein